MSDAKRFEAFGDFDPARYEAETRERWGDTPEYEEAQRRTRRYTRDDWATIRSETDGIFNDLARLASAGAPAEGADARAVAERHRRHIEHWFYPCPRSMHRGLGELLVNDPRFGERLERHAPGLAGYARDAWRANAEHPAD